MKTILYMAISVNGYIAKSDDNTDWVSEEDWNSFNNVSKKAGVVIIGKRTYEVMLPEQFIKECLYIVITHEKKFKEQKTENLLLTNKNPKEIIDDLKNEGYKNICVAGGSEINALFLKEGLIDEVYLDVEPVILGKGIPLFKPSNFNINLTLFKAKMLNANTIQLHYSINKSE